MTWEEFKTIFNRVPNGVQILLSNFKENQREDVLNYLNLLLGLGYVSQEDSDILFKKLQAYKKEMYLAPSLTEEECRDSLDALNYYDDYETITGQSHVKAIDDIFCKCFHCENPEQCIGRRIRTGKILREIETNLQNPAK